MNVSHTPILTLKPLTISVLLALSLTGCGGGSDANSNNAHNSNAQTQHNQSTPNPTQKPLGAYALAKAGDDAAFTNYYQAALNNSHHANGGIYPTVNESVPNSAGKETSAGNTANDSANNSSFATSSTNLIEAGVDEADFVKQTASHIFNISTAHNKNRQPFINSYDKASKTNMSKLPLKKFVNAHFAGFYLHNNNSTTNLVTVRQQSQSDWYYPHRDELTSSLNDANKDSTTDVNLDSKPVPTFHNAILAVDVINASNPANLTLDTTYTWDGEFKDSRRINDSLFVVSNSSIDNPEDCYIAYNEGSNTNNIGMQTPSPDVPVRSTAAPIANNPNIPNDAKPAGYPHACQPTALTQEQIIERMPVDITGKKIKPADCLIPANYNKNSANLNSDITLITQIDLTGAGKHQTTCIAASADNIYMSPNALYLAGLDYTMDDYLVSRPAPIANNTTDNPSNNLKDVVDSGKNILPDYLYNTPKTLINKFNLTNNKVSYAGTGAVTGKINWDAPSFSMNEYKGVLRVVTTDWQNGNIINQIHTLQEGKDKLALTTLATIPNKQQPKAIGKPNERVKGIRFVGDEGYVVTFQRTDPLYKIDLSDPKQPQVKGELQMTGYSTYLQRINDKLLLGVGFSADEEGRTTGLQTTVYDTSKNNPTIVSQDTISLSPEQARGLILPLDTDSRAIMTLKNANTMRVAIPYNISYYPQYNSQYENMRSQASSVEYNIDLKTGQLISYSPRALTPPLSNAQIGKQGLRGSFYNGETRALVDNNTLYYSLSNGTIKDYIWGVHKD